MRLRAVALALALSFGLTGSMEAKQRPAVHRSKTSKARKAPKARRSKASKQSKAAKVKPRKAPKHRVV
ncbi:MAG: hypothetical protein ABSH44_13020 [Bryobacteraceae bacterium]|jgi:hypothetical protein